MTVVDFTVTPANVHDSKMFIPLLSRIIPGKIGGRIQKMYGDNAYATKKNREKLRAHGIGDFFHRKSETGKHPKNKRAAKRKSKIRSIIEPLFGISQENLGFGAVRVRGLSNVEIDTSLVFIGWNLQAVYAFFIGHLEDRRSLKTLLYEH